jgi:hypothetical protein
MSSLWLKVQKTRQQIHNIDVRPPSRVDLHAYSVLCFFFHWRWWKTAKRWTMSSGAYFVAAFFCLICTALCTAHITKPCFLFAQCLDLLLAAFWIIGKRRHDFRRRVLVGVQPLVRVCAVCVSTTPAAVTSATTANEVLRLINMLDTWPLW